MQALPRAELITPAAPTTEGARPTPPALLALAAFCAAAILLIPLAWWLPGGAAWLLSLALAWRQPDGRVRQSLTVLLLCVGVLALAPIETDLDTAHFFRLGVPFLLVIVGPWLYFHRVAPGELEWRWLPRRISWHDLAYTLVAAPLSWAVLQFYFFRLNPELPTHWLRPPHDGVAAIPRLALGINLVGIWDELAFINTFYAILRRAFPARVANLAQACVYTAVLYDMAFTGHGAWIVYLFALTQGYMFEKSRVLLYVLIVHLIVDLFIVMAILQYHFPGQAMRLFL